VTPDPKRSRESAQSVESPPADLAEAVLAVVRRTYADLHPGGAAAGTLTLNSSLDRDWGFDSLARVELLLRLERMFSIRMPPGVLETAERPTDLVQALQRVGRVEVPSLPVVARDEAPATAAAIAPPPENLATLLEVLDWHVERHPDRIQLIYGDDPQDGRVERISYRRLHERAASFAVGLQARGLGHGQTVAIMLPTGSDYFYTYFGALMAGCVPVPIYPPARRSQLQEHIRRHARILANAEAQILVTIPEAIVVAHLLEAHVPGLRHIVTPAMLGESVGLPARIPARGSDIAFIQYTSGSTGNPKGVVLTHANLLANVRAIGAGVHISSQDVFVSWLPLYHDMGLIAAWLGSLYFGSQLVVMPPLAFLARPSRWLWAIHHYRGTITAAPNFAYELCTKRIDESELDGLDLSSMRLAANGSEAVVPETLERFQARFGRYGFRRTAMTPVYGLAEASVGLLAPPPGREPVIDRIQRQPFLCTGRARPAAADEPATLQFANCGRVLPGHSVRLVDAAGAEVGERIEGRLQFKGPSATQGYYRDPQQTRKLFTGDWLDSGDRAYRVGEEFYLTGRVKDIIQRGGRNLYPHEIEEVVGRLAGIRRGCVAAFGCLDRRNGTERLVVLAETRETRAQTRARLRGEITRVTVELLGEPPDEVVLAPPRTVLKTSSGKLRRSATRDLYEAGRVGTRPPAFGWQMVRLVGGALWPLLKRRLRAFREGGYAAYAWSLALLMAPPVWLATALTRRPVQAWWINRRAARLFLRLSGMSLVVRGLDNLPRDTPFVMVVNHSSYLDGVALLAALPGPYGFVAKRELLNRLVPRVLLRRLGCEFVERFAIRESVQDAQRIVQAAQAGRTLVFFPEGTFTAAPGLLPFHLGAFVAAVRANLQVVPVAVHGTREILRAHHWLPRPGAIGMRIGAPISPPRDASDLLRAAMHLSEQSRAWILAHCGELERRRLMSV